MRSSALRISCSGKFDFMLEGAILLVGFRVHHLTPSASEIFWSCVWLRLRDAFTVFLVGKKRGLIVVEAVEMTFQFFDFRDVLRESGDLLCQRGDPVI